jgi:hypothetical protein
MCFPLKVFFLEIPGKMRNISGRFRPFEMGLQPYPIVIIISCINAVIMKGIGHV